MVRSKNFLWPKFPISQYARNVQLFKFKNKIFYVDVPNPIIIKIYKEVIEKCDQERDKEQALECAKKIVSERNNEIKKYFSEFYSNEGNSIESFISVHVYPNVFSKKPFLFGYFLNKAKFLNFLTEFSESNKISLYVKYQYISLCKFSGMDFSTDTTFSFFSQNSASDSNLMREFIQNFDSLKKPIIEKINDTLCGLLGFLRDSLEKGRNIYNESAIVNFIPDVIAEINEIKMLVDKGFISSCYREIRGLTERLSYVILDDYLAINSFSLWKKYAQKDASLPSVLININPSWRDEKSGVIINLVEIIPTEIKKLLKQKEEEKLRRNFLRSMSIEMYVVLTGKPIHRGQESNAPSIESKSILKGIEEVKDCLGYTNKSVAEEFIKILEEKWNGFPNGIPRFPTSSFVFRFLKSVLSSKKLEYLESIWNNYSLFIHPYPFTWQLFPNTSLLEYRVFQVELLKSESVISTEINSILEYFKKLKRSEDTGSK